MCTKNNSGLDPFKARLSNTSELWVASIILVLNLIYLAKAQHCYGKTHYEEFDLNQEQDKQHVLIDNDLYGRTIFASKNKSDFITEKLYDDMISSRNFVNPER